MAPLEPRKLTDCAKVTPSHFMCLSETILLNLLGSHSLFYTICGFAGSSLLCGRLVVTASLLAEHGVWALGLQWLRLVGSVGAAASLQSTGLVAVARRTGLVALRRVESSWIRGGTYFSFTGRWILY